MKPMYRLLAAALLGIAFCSCATPAGNDRLEDRLDRRGGRTDQKLDRMEIRGEARGSRWDRMKAWEEDRYEKRWNQLMD